MLTLPRAVAQADMAAALRVHDSGLTADRIAVLSIAAGSVVVDFAVLPDGSGVNAMPTTSLASTLGGSISLSTVGATVLAVVSVPTVTVASSSSLADPVDDSPVVTISAASPTALHPTLAAAAVALLAVVWGW